MELSVADESECPRHQPHRLRLSPRLSCITSRSASRALLDEFMSCKTPLPVKGRLEELPR